MSLFRSLLNHCKDRRSLKNLWNYSIGDSIGDQSRNRVVHPSYDFWAGALVLNRPYTSLGLLWP